MFEIVSHLVVCDDRGLFADDFVYVSGEVGSCCLLFFGCIFADYNIYAKLTVFCDEKAGFLHWFC